MTVIGIILIILHSIGICCTQYCQGQLEINLKHLWFKAYYKRMHCTGQTTSSSSCSMSRILTGKESTVVSVNCPPHNKEVNCQFMTSKESGYSCQYYKQSVTGELTQFCCCFGKSCYQSINRLEYEQRSLRHLAVDPITAVFFVFTFLINIVTIKLFHNDLTNAVVLIYQMHSGITSSKLLQPEHKSLQNVEEKVISWKTHTLITTKMITLLTQSRKNKQNVNDDTKSGHKKLGMNESCQEGKQYMESQTLTEHYCRSERLLRQEWYRYNTLMKISYSHWRARERNQVGKQMRRTLKHLFEL
uniref:Phlebovirus glycoprotein G2 fusion domain-containing protein n=2 Tax=Wuchereria bancrofti TaxID=6293 RepID=A0AAF5RWU4_WUCBA